MEDKSGFKECPRCGLRNRISATKCDFCGYEFKDSTEEWSDYVDVLERMSKTEETDRVDEEISRKIKYTLVKSTKEVIEREPETPPVPSSSHIEGESPIEEESDVVDFVDSMIDEGGEEKKAVESETLEADAIQHHEYEAPEPASIEGGRGKSIRNESAAAVTAPPAPKESPLEEESMAEKTLEPEAIESEIGGETAEGPTPAEEYQDVMETPVSEGMNAEEAIAETESFSQEDAAVAQHTPSKQATTSKSLEMEPVESVVSTTQTALLLYVASICLGAALYLVALGGHFMFSLDVAASWAIVVAGSILMLLGLRRFYDVVLPISDARRGNIGT